MHDSTLNEFICAYICINNCLILWIIIVIYTWTDGHHKLICWRLVTHAGIDGFSRLIVFMHCSNNNWSLTVYEHFLEATRKYGLPSRVRTDQGRENMMVAQHMLEHRGMSHGSIITGSSVHNQRIERLYGRTCFNLLFPFIIGCFILWSNKIYLIL